MSALSSEEVSLAVLRVLPMDELNIRRGYAPKGIFRVRLNLALERLLRMSLVEIPPDDPNIVHCTSSGRRLLDEVQFALDDAVRAMYAADRAAHHGTGTHGDVFGRRSWAPPPPTHDDVVAVERAALKDLFDQFAPSSK